MQGTYDMTLVFLSFVVACVASYTALELARRVSAASGAARLAWLGGGAVSMGVGIWTMHFVGMLAFSLPMPFSYDVGITLLSLLVGILASAFAIHVASRPSNSIANIGLSGLLLGGGIASMHYTGMLAMTMDGTMSYDQAIVALSVVIAVVAACAAIWIIFQLSRSENQNLALLKVGAAVIMGIAICGMHYTGMAAVSYMPASDVMSPVDNAGNTWLAATMGAMALVILGITHLTIFFDYRVGVEKKISEKAEQEAVQLSEILDESSNEIYFFDSETLRFVNVNRGAVENLGYSKKELLSMTPLSLKKHLDEESFEDKLEPLRTQSKKDMLFEAIHRRKDGSEYPVQAHVQMSQMTEPPLFVAIITDITERKQLESQLMQAKKMESIGQLAAGIAHEINTPAQFVGDNTRFIKDAFQDLLQFSDTSANYIDAAKNDSVTPALLDALDESFRKADLEYLRDEIPTAFEQTIDGITRISNIVRAMKEFSHPGGSDRELTDLNQAVTNTLTVASNEWKYVADVETVLADELPPVLCFPQEINQVILNLIVNAAQAIAEKNGENAAEKGKISISTHQMEQEIELRISDSGCGIPDDIIDRIFDPFFTTKEVGTGSGQGLAMAYKTIVEKHGGKLRAESTPGSGATFAICLPLDSNDTHTHEVAA